MVSPTRKRDAIAALQAQYRAATRRACLLVGQNRSTQLYRSKAKDSSALRARMRDIASARPRYGYRRIHTLLRREGWKDGLNRVHRLYRLDGLHVRLKPKKKRRAVVRVPPAQATAPNERWAIDFVHDALDDGRPFRVLTVVDLRNPLGAIMTSAALMIRREGPDWHHSKTAARILNSGTRMNAMISDLVDFTRGRLGGGIPIDRADMDMEAVCRQTVEELTAFHPNFSVRFEASGPQRGQWDGARIAQVLSNLVGNAFQHGLEGRPVDVVVRGEPDEVVLSVHNEGSAIAKAQLQSIFDPFRQLDARRAKSKDLRSVGLGLYIARAIVTAHRGRIDVESTEARGTTFTVRLPRDFPRREKT